MLRRLEIWNFAVISHCIFEPHMGLNVITGETGAGKSLIIDAIGLILGQKANKSIIRTDSDKACVEAVFDFIGVSSSVINEIDSILEEYGISSDESGTLIVSREFSVDGRSMVRVNGKNVILSVLRQITSLLIDVHGQNDTQLIFDTKSHVSFLDRYIGEEAKNLLEQYREALSAYKNIVVEIRNCSVPSDVVEKRKDYLSYAIEEITNANLKIGEDDILLEQKKKLTNYGKITTLLERIDYLIHSSDTPIDSSCIEVASLLDKLTSIDDDYTSLSDKMSSLALDIEALSSDIHSRFEQTDSVSRSIDDINSRISDIFSLKSKYGDTIEDIIAFKDKALQEISEFDSIDDKLRSLKKERSEVEKILLNKANELSSVRHARALELSNRIIEQLQELEMPSCRFAVEFLEHSKSRYFSNMGTEDISFVFSANPGEDMKLLSKIASGGEASRIMLAIKTILSQADDTSTLIFDEIDSGISGQAASTVASKLRMIGNNHQVLAVSHMAQIAASAEHNYFIHKETNLISSHTVVNELSSTDKELEVSRLLTGTSDPKSLELARELIAGYS